MRLMRGGVALFSPAIIFTKLSVILLFKRVFTAVRTRQLLYAVAAVVVLSNLASIILGLASCVPIERNWNGESKGNCFDPRPMFVVYCACDAITTIILVALPVRYLWQLQISRSYRILAFGTLLFGLS